MILSMATVSLKRQCRLLTLAFGFYSRFPVPFVAAERKEIGQASIYLPLVGLFIGAILGAVSMVLSTHLPVSIVGAIIIAIGVFLSGGLHEDGLADFFDGFWGGHDRKRVLEIMQDSRVGVFGLLAVIGVLSIQYQCLVALPIEEWFVFLVVLQTWSRTWALILPFFLTYARSESAPSNIAADLGKPSLWLYMLLIAGGCLLPQVGLDAHLVTALTVSSTILSILLGLWMWRRIGGYTGDCLGAAQQLQLVVGCIIWVWCVT